MIKTCEICGKKFDAQGDRVCCSFKCNSERLNLGAIEDGAVSFECESDITCPYCGAIIQYGFTRSWDENESYTDGGLMTCNGCGKTFWLQTVREYSYNTYQLNENGEPMN